MNNSIRYNGKLNVIGNIIRKYRLSANLSQDDVSSKLLLLGINIHPKSYQRLENGERAIRDYELGAIAKVLNVSTDELLKDFMKDLI